MKRFLKLKRVGGEKGFTLIELLVVIAILGIVAGIAIPNVVQFMGKGDEEAKLTEHHNVQTAVLALMADAANAGGVHQLDQSYSDIQVQAGVAGVKATADGTPYTLDSYLVGEPYPLRQAYDISQIGYVSVHSS